MPEPGDVRDGLVWVGDKWVPLRPSSLADDKPEPASPPAPTPPSEPASEPDPVHEVTTAAPAPAAAAPEPAATTATPEPPTQPARATESMGTATPPSPTAEPQHSHRGLWIGLVAVVVVAVAAAAGVLIWRAGQAGPGDIAIPAGFRSASSFTADGLAKVSVAENQYGYIDTTGALVIPATYQDATSFDSGVALVQTADGTVQVIDTTGTVVRSLPGVLPGDETGFLHGFHDGYAAVFVDEMRDQNNVFINNKWGYIDTTGDFAVRPAFEWADDFSEGLAAVSVDGQRRGYINTGGDLVIRDTLAKALDFHEGLAAVTQPVPVDKYGYINTSGDPVIATEYDSATPFSEGHAAAQTTEGWVILDKTGQTVPVDPSVQQMGPFANGLAEARVGNTYGYVDTTGCLAIPAQYNATQPFVDGTAVVKVDNQWGFIDTTGSWTVEPSITADGLFGIRCTPGSPLGVIEVSDTQAGYIRCR